MHVRTFLHKTLDSAIHIMRVEALSEVVEGLIHSKRLELTAMGRSLQSSIQERSGIQKVNRLLGNQNLLAECLLIYSRFAHCLIGIKQHPLIIVDWTKYPQSEDAVLRAAVAIEGRAVTVYEERHSVKRVGNHGVHKRFLKKLKEVLPTNCCPVMISDAGFQNPWFREIMRLGWDYVGRIRGIKRCHLAGEKHSVLCKTLFKRADKTMRFLGKATLTETNPLETNLYLMKSRLKGRKKHRRDGKVDKHKDSKAYSRAQREPWLLASSLTGRWAAKRVKEIYRRRMGIEEAFRDLKSSRYGFGLNNSKTRKAKRRDILLLIAALAGLIAWLMGKIAEQLYWHLEFQSNSVKYRRVLSFFYLGCQVIRKRKKIPIGLWNELIKNFPKGVIYA